MPQHADSARTHTHTCQRVWDVEVLWPGSGKYEQQLWTGDICSSSAIWRHCHRCCCSTGQKWGEAQSQLPISQFVSRPHSSQLRITLALKRNSSACVCAGPLLLLLLVKHDTCQDPGAIGTQGSDSEMTISD